MILTFIFILIPAALLSLICRIFYYPIAIWVVLVPPITISAIMNLISVIYRIYNRKKGRNLPVIKED